VGSIVARFIYSCLAILKKQQYFLLNKWKDNKSCVNIFRKHIYRIITLLSTHYKTYCFAFQKRRFCTVKAALLHRKTYAFATSNRNYRFYQNYLYKIVSKTCHQRGGFMIKLWA